jgi:FtsP/CotA-like multicopper oxidase with cupredoxin domain
LQRFVLLAIAIIALWPAVVRAQSAPDEDCPRPEAGTHVTEPEDLRSQNGVLKVEFTFHNFLDAKVHMRYCYLAAGRYQSPNLRLHPGDLLVLTLKNQMTLPTEASPMPAHASAMIEACAGGGEMTASATNLHFHGLAIPPVCHQDDVLKTSVRPTDGAYEYRVRIPVDQPPGLYWYHPHLHGFSKGQVLGGASGALVVEGLERVNREVAGLPERVLIIRDQDLLNPNAPAADSASAIAPAVILDRDGDARNTGSGTGKPAKDLSVNFVPVPYPNYEPAVIRMKPGEQQLWRVLNASAITYLNLQVVTDGKPQMLGVVALDGVSINHNGLGGKGLVLQNHLGVPPGGRVEFIVKGPAEGVRASLMTRSVNTGAGGENDPTRPLATIVATNDAPEPRSALPVTPEPLVEKKPAWLGSVTPVRTRRLYFSETLLDPSDPNSPTTFYITVEGQSPVAFDPHSTIPNIIVRQGDVEDWIIENRSQELHAFHIHQIHFMLLEFFGIPVNEPFLRDTINVPFWDGKSAKFPTVKLRMDFRNPSILGTFPFHCHLLEHEDGGMMGLIRVDPPESTEGPRILQPASAGGPAKNRR